MKIRTLLYVVLSISGCLPLPSYSPISVPPLHGTVRDQTTEKPIKGAEVLVRYVEQFREDGPLISRTSDDAGTFVLEPFEYRSRVYFFPLTPIGQVLPHFLVTTAHPNYKPGTAWCDSLKSCVYYGTRMECADPVCIVNLEPLDPAFY